MLPPFVPPSARVTSESLPLITEFVIERVEHSFESPLGATPEFASAAPRSVAFGEQLRSIDEFRWRWRVSDRPADIAADQGAGDTVDEPDALGAVGLPDAMESGPADMPGEPSPIPSGTLAFVEETIPDAHPAGVPEPIVNDAADEGAAWAAAAADAALQAEPATTPVTTPVEQTEATGPELSPASEVSASPAAPAAAADTWVAEERDAFDWHGVANLAVAPDEERRAAEEWSGTQWERTADTAQDHVAGLLSQVARRVRAGELSVQGSKQMSAEAALAAVLTALLSEEGNDE